MPPLSLAAWWKSLLLPHPRCLGSSETMPLWKKGSRPQAKINKRGPSKLGIEVEIQHRQLHARVNADLRDINMHAIGACTPDGQ